MPHRLKDEFLFAIGSYVATQRGVIFLMKVELIAVTKYLRGDGTPEELLEHAGRVCYRHRQGDLR
jgi:DNA replication protein DnaD